MANTTCQRLSIVYFGLRAGIRCTEPGWLLRVKNPLFETGSSTSEVPATTDSFSKNVENTLENRLISTAVKTVKMCQYASLEIARFGVIFAFRCCRPRRPVYQKQTLLIHGIVRRRWMSLINSTRIEVAPFGM